MISDIKAKVDQLSPDVLSEGNMDFPRMTNLGQLYTLDWKMRAILAGKAYRVSMGTMSTGTSHVLVGNGTTVDLDIPQLVLAVDTGYLIPMSLQGCFISDSDSENDIVSIILTADRATALSAADVATGAGTAETPDNLLDGGPAFVGRVESITGTAIGSSDPVHSDILYFNNWETLETDPLGPTNYFVDHEFEYPNLIAGPCSLYLYFAGVVAVTGMASLVFAHIPASWAPAS